jgi:uncharacterized membrane protein
MVCWLLLPAAGFLFLLSWYMPYTRNEQNKFAVTYVVYNKVHELATVCLLWQHWTWFDDVDILAFHSCVVIDLWQSVSEWHLLLSACVLVCRHESVGA